MNSGALPPLPPHPSAPRGRRRPPSPELLRCKRRLAFASLPGTGGAAAAVARRNERERNRVRLVNLGFAALRQHVPHGAASKKMSKVETLRSAVEYIRALQRLRGKRWRQRWLLLCLPLLLRGEWLRWGAQPRGAGAVGFHQLARELLSCREIYLRALRLP